MWKNTSGSCAQWLASIWRGVGDVPEDAYHRGFAAYRWLSRRLAPRLWIHGHTALSTVAGWRQDLGGTTFVNVTGAVLIDFAAAAAGTTIANGSGRQQATGEAHQVAADRPLRAQQRQLRRKEI